MLFLLVAGCTKTTYIKQGGSPEDVGRIVIKKLSMFDTKSWDAWIARVIDVDGKNVIRQGKTYQTISLSEGVYQIGLSCVKTDRNIWDAKSELLNLTVEKGKEYAVRCEHYLSDERDKLGFKKERLRAKVVEVTDINGKATNESLQEINGSAQKMITMAQFCELNLCRENVTIKLRTERGLYEEQLPLYWPAVYGDIISIFPGETVYAEAMVENNKIVYLRQVNQNKNPERTLVFEFKQTEDLSKLDVMLSVENPFEKALKYDLKMKDFNGELHHTSSCPVYKRVFEHWPHPIVELGISKLRLLEKGSVVGCE